MKARLTAKDFENLQQTVKSKAESKPRYIIGIDPDTEKCGVAVKQAGTKEIQSAQALPFFDVLKTINSLNADKGAIVYIDAGWLISKSNWHENQGTRRGEKIAKNVGACHQVGKLIAEYCRMKGIVCHEVRPTGAKVGAKQFEKLGAWQGRINQDVRDAVMLIFNK